MPMTGGFSPWSKFNAHSWSVLNARRHVKTKNGFHHYFRRATGTFATSDGYRAELHPSRIDVKTGRGLVVLPPSTGKALEINEAKRANDLVKVDQDFIDAVFIHNGRSAPRLKADTSSPRMPMELTDQRLKRVQALLEHIDPNTDYFDWLHVLMAIYNESSGSEDGFAIADSWSSGGSNYKGLSEIRAKWNSFRFDVEGGYTIGTLIMMVENNGIDWIAVCDAVEPQFESEADWEQVDPGKQSLQAINSSGNSSERSSPKGMDALTTIQQQYGLINMDGKLWVLDRRSFAARTTEGAAKKLVLSNRGDGSMLIERAVHAQFQQVNALKIIKEFFVSPKTVCYDGVDFNPAGTLGNYLNLWVGPTLTPKAGDWSQIRSFLLQVICDNDSNSYEYLIRYIAHALQRPEDKPGVMIILLGGQGTGKGTLGRILRAIWSATYLQVINIDAVTGNFNAALERVFIVFMDEALFSGDRKASDALKSLVTETVIPINEKYQPARQTRSYHRFFAATNAEHFKNTERDDRRDFVLRVSEAHKSDRPYWQALHHEIDSGGVAAMIHYLQSLDLAGFQVRDKPKTKGLLDQKLHSLVGIERWWYDCLLTGGVSEDEEWPDFIGTLTSLTSVVELAGGRMFKKPTANDFGRSMMKLCPSAVQGQTKKDGQFGSRQRGLHIPPLQTARAEFEKYIGSVIVWESENTSHQ